MPDLILEPGSRMWWKRPTYSGKGGTRRGHQRVPVVYVRMSTKSSCRAMVTLPNGEPKYVDPEQLEIRQGDVRG